MRKRRNRLALLLCLACLGASAYPSRGGAVEGPAGRAGLLAAGDPAPDWKLTDAEGRTHTLSQYRGRVVVLDFWATWCGPCVKVMQRVEKLHQKHKGEGLVVFGVNSFETGDPVAFMKKKKSSYGLLLKGEEIAPAYGVETLPAVCVIGPDGRVVYSHAGADHKNLDSVIEKQLKRQGT